MKSVGRAMQELTLTSRVDAKWRQRVEDLLFFNSQQTRHSDAILAAVQQYGQPEITEDAGRLLVNVPGMPGVQTLYAVSAQGEPIGVMVFGRPTPTDLVLVHIATEPDSGMLAVRMIDRLRGIGQRIGGVQAIVVLYEQGRRCRLPVVRRERIESC